MKRTVLCVGLVGMLAACSPTTGSQIAGTFAGAAGLGVLPVVGGSPAAGSGGFGSEKLPDTPQCKEYKRYARVAGAPGTMSSLIKKYNACLNSAPNSKASRQYRCAPGTYVSYINGVRQCRKR